MPMPEEKRADGMASDTMTIRQELPKALPTPWIRRKALRIRITGMPVAAERAGAKLKPR